MIAIVDYGAGNLRSVQKALDSLDQENVITSDPGQVSRASKILLPGVGHFASTASLHRLGLQKTILESIERSTPFLGICVGMQWLYHGSAESPATSGLGILPGRCERFPAEVKSPHVGWNSLQIHSTSRLFHGIASSSFVYFTHSFRCPLGSGTAACCDYGGKFSAAVEAGNVFGVQFHPEKSGDTGLQLLANFCAL